MDAHATLPEWRVLVDRRGFTPDGRRDPADRRAAGGARSLVRMARWQRQCRDADRCARCWNSDSSRHPWSRGTGAGHGGRHAPRRWSRSGMEARRERRRCRSVATRRGSAILLALFVLLLLEILVAGLFWTLRVEARAGLESLAGATGGRRERGGNGRRRATWWSATPAGERGCRAHAPAAARATARARGRVCGTHPRSTPRWWRCWRRALPGAMGVSARRQACALFHLVRVVDSTGAGSVRLVPVPERPVTNC